MTFLSKLRKHLPIPRFRIVPLSPNTLSPSRYDAAAADPALNGIIDDLRAYTGFGDEELRPLITRHPDKHFESEFAWARPRDRQELTWFYRCSQAYLFANAIHPFATALERIPAGRVLDYGAGVGCNTIGMALRGLDVDFLEIGRLQADFLRFRIDRRELKNVREVLPYNAGRFDPIGCITATYDTIAAMDVLEHIPDYHIVVRHFIEHLAPGGLIVENSPFAPEARDVSIHVSASMPLEQAMDGMRRLEPGIWQKI